MTGATPYIVALMAAAISALFVALMKSHKDLVDDLKERDETNTKLLKDMTDSMQRAANAQELTNATFKDLLNDTLWQTVYDAVSLALQDESGTAPPARPNRRRVHRSTGSTGAPLP